MTKIRIIGNPGQQGVEILKAWLEKFLRKFNLCPNEVHLVFIENIQQFDEVLQRYSKPISGLSPEENWLLTEMEFENLYCTGYLHENSRKETASPIILIKKDIEISEYALLDEVAHMSEDKHGWYKAKAKAFRLLNGKIFEFRDICKELQMDISLLPSFFSWFRDQFFDFFSNEMMCQYNLIEELFRDREKRLNDLVEGARTILPFRPKIIDFGIAMSATFFSILPPSYPQKEDEKKLEKKVINCIRQMSMEEEYRKIKSVVSQLESPPDANNIYKCAVEIIELAQEFLER